MQSDKSLIATQRTILHQRETNVDTIRFLIPPMYEDFNIADFTAVVKYVTPDNQAHCEQIYLEELPYKNYLDYRLGIDTDITAMAGKTELHLTFLKVYQDEDGISKEHVLHSGNTYIEVNPVKELIFVPDKSLEVIDQIILTMDDKINQLNSIAETLKKQKADDIEIIDGEIWLVSTNPETGEKIPIGDPISGVSHVWVEM